MEVLIEKLDHQGRGIAYINNKICFISNALINEKVEIDIVKDTKKYCIGKVKKYITKSSIRVDALCPYFDKCGGCRLMMMKYEDTLAYKKNKVKEILHKYADIDVNPEIVSANTLNYRNKIELKINNYEIGFYEEETNNIVNIKKCIITDDIINEIIPKIKLKQGNVTIRVNNINEVLLIITTDEEVSVDSFKMENVKGIILNDKLIYGQEYLIYEINNLKYKVSYNAFFQINNEINSLIGKKLQSMDFSKDTLVDLYCGVGSLSIGLNTKKTIGIEVVENSIINARENALLNNRKDIEFICDDAKAIKDIKQIDTLIVDPPRKGLSDVVIKNIIDKNIRRLIYISCDPLTFARDMKLLKNYYELNELTLYDMFPYTHHIECMSVLNRKEK